MDTPLPGAPQVPCGAEASVLLPCQKAQVPSSRAAGGEHPWCWLLLDGKSLVFLYLGHMPPYQVTSQDHWPPLTSQDNLV